MSDATEPSTRIPGIVTYSFNAPASAGSSGWYVRDPAGPDGKTFFPNFRQGSEFISLMNEGADRDAVLAVVRPNPGDVHEYRETRTPRGLPELFKELNRCRSGIATS